MDTKKIAIGVIALALVGFAAFQFMGDDSSDKMAADKNGAVMEEKGEAMESGDKMEASDDETAEFADGEYTATGHYDSPAGEEELDVTVTLEDGIITETSVEALATHEVSIKMQNAFISGVEEEVVGKRIDEVDLDVVAGSSLTSDGYEDALEHIMEEARG